MFWKIWKMRIHTVNTGNHQLQQMRKARKVALSQMSTDQREIEKAKRRFLRTAVNFPMTQDCDNPSATARMLVSEFEILMVRLTRLCVPTATGKLTRRPVSHVAAVRRPNREQSGA